MLPSPRLTRRPRPSQRTFRHPPQAVLSDASATCFLHLRQLETPLPSHSLYQKNQRPRDRWGLYCHTRTRCTHLGVLVLPWALALELAQGAVPAFLLEQGVLQERVFLLERRTVLAFLLERMGAESPSGQIPPRLPGRRLPTDK